jgi:hypothetical protein
MDKAGSSTCEYALGYTNAEHERLIRRNFIVLALISQQKNKKAVVSWHNSYSE